MAFWQQQLQLLKNRSFQFYLYSCIAGTFASGLAYITTIWMIVNLHSSINATLTGMIIFWFPSLLLSAHIGAIVDRYDRKKLIIIAASLRVIMFTVFAILLFYRAELWLIYLLLLLSGCFAAFYYPLLPAFVQEIVPKEQLMYANTNINMAYEFGNIIGRGIITVAVLSLLGNCGALLMVAFLYLINAITMIPVERYASTITFVSAKRPGIVESINEGYRYLFAHKKLCLYAVVQAILLMSLMAAPVLVGPYVKVVLKAGNSVFGISEAAISSGAIAGAFFWSYLANRISKETCLAIASIGAGISYLTLANTAEINYALIAFLLLGFSWGSFALIMSLVQMLSDKSFQGRIQATISMAVTSIFILFSISLHILNNNNVGVQHAYMLLASLCPCVFVGIMVARRIKHNE